MYQFEVDGGGKIDLESSETDPRWLAEEAAEYYHDNCDGWESSWPLEIELFKDFISLGIFVVDLEHRPHFYAYKKE